MRILFCGAVVLGSCSAALVPQEELSCSGYTVCQDCTAQSSAGGGGCGWCAVSSQCLFGTSSGPLAGSCGSWEWQQGQCDATAIPPTPAPPPPVIPPDEGSPPWNGVGGDKYASFYRHESLLLGGEANATLAPYLRWTGTPSKGVDYITAGAGVVPWMSRYRFGSLPHHTAFELDTHNDTTGVSLGSHQVEESYHKIGSKLYSPAFDQERGLAFMEYLMLWSGSASTGVVAFQLPPKPAPLSPPNSNYPRVVWKWNRGSKSTRGLLHLKEKDQLHVMVDNDWTVINATTGSVLWQDNPVPGVTSSPNGEKQILELKDNVYLFASANDWGTRFVAGLYGQFQTVVWVYKNDNFTGFATTLPDKNTFLIPEIVSQTRANITAYKNTGAAPPKKLWSVGPVDRNQGETNPVPLHVASDGERFWMPGVYGSSPITQRSVETGEIIPGAATYDAGLDPAHWYSNGIIATKDLVIEVSSTFTTSEHRGGKISIWHRESGEVVDTTRLNSQLQEATEGQKFKPTKNVIYRGGWLYLCGDIQGIQGVAASVVAVSLLG